MVLVVQFFDISVATIKTLGLRVNRENVEFNASLAEEIEIPKLPSGLSTAGRVLMPVLSRLTITRDFAVDAGEPVHGRVYRRFGSRQIPRPAASKQ